MNTTCSTFTSLSLTNLLHHSLYQMGCQKCRVDQCKLFEAFSLFSIESGYLKYRKFFYGHCLFDSCCHVCLSLKITFMLNAPFFSVECFLSFAINPVCSMAISYLCDVDVHNIWPDCIQDARVVSHHMVSFMKCSRIPFVNSFSIDCW